MNKRSGTGGKADPVRKTGKRLNKRGGLRSPGNPGLEPGRPALDVFVPNKEKRSGRSRDNGTTVPERVTPTPGSRARVGRVRPALDVFVPVKKARAPTYMDERAARLGSNNVTHPWACEPADDVTMAQLARLAGGTVADLQWRRHPHDDQCPETVPVTRRRCMTCPFWARHPDLTPFDGTPIAVETEGAV